MLCWIHSAHSTYMYAICNMAVQCEFCTLGMTSPWHFRIDSKTTTKIIHEKSSPKLAQLQIFNQFWLIKRQKHGRPRLVLFLKLSFRVTFLKTSRKVCKIIWFRVQFGTNLNGWVVKEFNSGFLKTHEFKFIPNCTRKNIWFLINNTNSNISNKPCTLRKLKMIF